MSALRTIAVGLWRGLDGLRKFLHLLLLLLIFGFVVGALHVSVPRVPDSAVLLVRPQGELVEQLSGEPLERAVAEARGQGHAETLLWDLIDAIRGAAKDDRIKVMVLDLDQFDGADGLPPLEELARAIRDFRASGKPVIAYASTYTRDQYFLAAQASEVDLDPEGYVLIDGYGQYPLYFKDLIDKLGIDVNVFRVGEYKSAVEPYTRASMSEPDRQQTSEFLGAVWSAYQTEATSARRIESDSIQQYIATLPSTVVAAHGAAAEVALKAGLVTRLETKAQLERRLIALVGEDESSSTFYSVTADDYARVVHADSARHREHARIGVIVASGEILDGTQPPGTIGGDSLVRLLREARLDDKIRAVVLRIDSPGGSVTASEQIYEELKTLEAAGKPVVVSMGSYAASGGYYISAPADEIWASAATITGSIGIFSVVPTIDRTLQKFGIGVDGVGTTPLSGELELTRPLNDAMRTFLQETVDHGYDVFVERVATGRHMTPASVDSIGQGHVWAGADAAHIGLVDHLGSFDDAVRAAARRAKVKHYSVQFIQPELSWPESLALELDSLGARVLLAAAPHSDAGAFIAARLDPLEHELAQLRRFSVPNRLYAYCFCTIR
ncbi:MAG TPA: signal peptide peptidase SppA [Steroidobacteraceae bacterium]|nr:signal peptide peptidase SppA [Steroidobacteraceae bacterium]